VVVSVAPGFLSGYTKIVRFVPRYVLVNQLEYPIRLWQDSSVFRPLNEDRSTTGIDELVRGTDMGKWRFSSAEDKKHDVINEYEALWGRVTLLDESDSDRTMEGTTAHRQASYITTCGPLEFVPFHLPDSRGERQLRVDLGAAWNLTASFASDFPGDHTLRVTQSVDLRFVRHVSTRASPQYKVCVPPTQGGGARDWDGELGIWFETDWGGDRRIIVKGMKRGRHCFNETDIHAGDELLRVDNISVSRMTFPETMKLLKQRLAQVSAVHTNTKSRMSDQSSSRWLDRSSAFIRKRFNDEVEDDSTTQERLVLTFRTLEERLRRLRVKAAKNSGMKMAGRGGHGGPSGSDSVSQQGGQGGLNRTLGGLRVEMKPLHHSMFVVLRQQDSDNPPFRIENRSMNHTIFFRQRGCEGHPWNSLKPGQTQAYSWEEPMRPKRLSVRAARDGLCLSRTQESEGDDNSVGSFTSDGISRENDKRAARSAKLRQALSYQYVEDEEQGRFGAATIVKLEEIGYRGHLACPTGATEDLDARRSRHLNVDVETDGATRIMVASDDNYHDDDVMIMNRRLESLKRQVREEESRLANLAALRYLLAGTSSGTSIEGSVFEGAALSNLSLYTQQVEGVDADERFRIIEDLAKNITDDFPEDTSIHRKHQVVVEVLEAVGLNPENEIGSCNPYCEVILKGRSKLRKSLFEKRRDKGKTYYTKKTLSPRWTDQIFVFDVPAEAVSVTRGHSIHVRCRNFRFVGAHKLLGQAVVHLHNVRDQQELVGWYPLAGRTGSTELDNPLSHWGRGSIKLRIHWVHSTPALVDCFTLFTDRRLQLMQERRNGLKKQWKSASEAEKRRKEGDTLKSAVSQSVPKVQKEKHSRRGVQSSKESDSKEDESKSFFDPLKMARDRTRLVSYFQKIAKTKGRRDADEHGIDYDSERWTGGGPGLPKITEHGITSDDDSSGSRSSMYEMSSIEGESNDDSGENYGRPGKRSSLLSHGSLASANDNAHASQHDSRTNQGNRRRTIRPRPNDGQGALTDRGHARSTGKLFANKLLQKLSQKKGMKDNLPNKMSDFNPDEEDENKKLAPKFSNYETVKELLQQGLILHEVGQYFHRVDPYRFQGTADDGRVLQIPRVRNWTMAQNFLNDETIDLEIVEPSSFRVVIHADVSVPRAAIDSGGSFSKRIAKERLQLPSLAPVSMRQRALQHVEYLVQSRNQFERACRRALRSVLNPGGWLTIRPITVSFSDLEWPVPN
jgi:C2 domain/SHR-binding domain of vacuolar-sorting associated protein 13